ncbi:MAG: hydrogenase iron-sulfur subunit [Deltaproteobacteria bacterium]|nr:hydrogenase iron-sulfur subunit [Deltaproteobacteria bacterium]
MKRDVPDARFTPDVALLCCKQCLADPGVTSGLLEAKGCRARLVVLPCSSKLEGSYLLKILANGTDAVQVVGCPEGACRFGVGSRMALKRVERARGLLDEIGFGAERLAMERTTGLGRQDLAALAAGRAEAIRPLGASPMKGDEKA